MTARLYIQLFGEFGLTYDGQAVTQVNRPRWQSLLAYLLLHRHAPQPRRHLAFLLWPDSTEAQALTNLRHILHHLQRTLPDADCFILSDSQTLGWRADAPFALDVQLFEEMVARGGAGDLLEATTTLYRGDLLSGCYDDWILPERERLRQLFTSALERLSRMFESAADYASAILASERLLNTDPLREETYRHLMRLHALNSDRAAALHIYHRCATTLQRDLGVEPSAATRAIYQRILAAAPVVPSAPAPAGPAASAWPELAGRAREWAALVDAWRAVPRTGPRVALISGEAGIGKTRLAEDLLDWVSRQGAAAAVTRCYAGEGHLAYAPIATWLRTLLPCIRDVKLCALDDVWLTEVARLVPEALSWRLGLDPPGPLVEVWQRHRFFEGLSRALLIAGQPLLLVIDDLQRCDRETIEWLRYFMRFDRGARLLVVALLRPEEVDADHPVAALLAALRREQQLTEIELEPLDRDATASIAEGIAGARLAPDLLDRVYQDTEGNPLFVVETMRAYLAGQPALAADGRAPSPAPPRVQAIIAERLALLSPAARQLAGTAAAIGRDFSFRVLAEATRMDSDAVVRGLDELWRRRIVRERGSDDYDFYHDRLRDVAYAGLGAARRQVLHGRIAQALISIYGGTALEGSVCGQIAANSERAGMAEQAARYYWLAARYERRLSANADAAAYLERALALLPSSPPPSAAAGARNRELFGLAVTIHGDLAELLCLNGRPAAARTECQHGLAWLNADGSGELTLQHSGLLRRIARTWLDEGDLPAAGRALDQAEAVLQFTGRPADSEWWQEWIEIRLQRVNLHYWADRWQDIATLVESVRPIVERYGTALQRADLQRGLLHSLVRRDRYRPSAQALAAGATYLHLAQESGDRRTIAAAQFESGVTLLASGNARDAAGLLRAAYQAAQREGDCRGQLLCLTYVTLCERVQGHVSEVEALVTRTTALAEAISGQDYDGALLANQSWLAWRSGQPDQAIRCGQRALAFWREIRLPYVLQTAALWPLLAATLGLTPRHAGSEASGRQAGTAMPGPAPSAGQMEAAVAAAIEYATRLLEPAQHGLDTGLAAEVSAGVRTYRQGAAEQAYGHLACAVDLAQDLGYL